MIARGMGISSSKMVPVAKDDHHEGKCGVVICNNILETMTEKNHVQLVQKVSDVFNAVIDRTDKAMLSERVCKWQYPRVSNNNGSLSIRMLKPFLTNMVNDLTDNFRA